MIYINLFIEFFKIGLFTFGGGYAMIPLMTDTIEKNQWISSGEFTQIIAIAEMTPGPIAINSATFIGQKVAGIGGSLAATLGVAAPSLLLILFISKVFFTYSEHPLMKSIFKGIRPVVAGLVLAAGFSIAQTVLFTEADNPFHLNFVTLSAMVVLFGIMLKHKLHPIILIFIAGSLGFLSFAFF